MGTGSERNREGEKEVECLRRPPVFPEKERNAVPRGQREWDSGTTGSTLKKKKHTELLGRGERDTGSVKKNKLWIPPVLFGGWGFVGGEESIPSD